MSPTSSLLHLHQYKCTNLARWISLSLSLNPGITIWCPDNGERGVLLFLLYLRIIVASTNQTLGGVQSILGIGDGLTFRRGSNQPFPLRCKSNNGRCSTGTLSILQNFWCFSFHHSNTRVSGPKVNTNNMTLWGRRETSRDILQDRRLKRHKDKEQTTYNTLLIDDSEIAEHSETQNDARQKNEPSRRPTLPSRLFKQNSLL